VELPALAQGQGGVEEAPLPLPGEAVALAVEQKPLPLQLVQVGQGPQGVQGLLRDGPGHHRKPLQGEAGRLAQKAGLEAELGQGTPGPLGAGPPLGDPLRLSPRQNVGLGNLGEGQALQQALSGLRPGEGGEVHHQDPLGGVLSPQLQEEPGLLSRVQAEDQKGLGAEEVLEGYLGIGGLQVDQALGARGLVEGKPQDSRQALGESPVPRPKPPAKHQQKRRAQSG